MILSFYLLRYPRRGTLMLVAGALLLSAGAGAAGNNVPEDIPVIVITPRRAPTRVESISVAVSVVDRTEIEEKGMTQIQDAVEDLPGVSLSRSDTPGGFSSLFMRGTESDQTLVLLDGMPINDPSGTTGAFNFSQDLLGDIERVEVVRGPASVLYGSSAIGGVVNLISRVPANDSLRPRGEAYGGTQGTGGGAGLVSGTWGKVSYVYSIEGQHTDGFNTLPSRFPNNPKDAKFSNTATLFGKLSTTLDDATRLQAEVRWRNLDFALNDGAVSTPNYFGQNATLFWQARGEHDWLGKEAQSSLSVGQTRVDRAYRNDPNAVAFAAGSPWLRATYSGTRTMLNAQNDAHLPDAAAFDKLMIVAGVNYANEFTDVDYQNAGLYGPFNQLVHAATSQTGVFGELHGRVLRRIDLTSGLREDFPQVYPNHATMRFGGVLQLPEFAGRVKSSYGTSYRTPSLFERFGVDNYGLVGNSSLRPEKASSWDAGIEKDFELFGNLRFARFAATYFETSTRNLIQYDFGPTPQYKNVGHAEINGVENQIKISPFPWLEGEATWTWLQSINASGATFSGTPNGGQLLRRPKNTATASVTVWALPEWRLTPKLRYVGPQFDQLYADSGAFLGRGRVGGFILADMATDYRLKDHVSVYAHIHNLFNRTVESPNGYLLEPLTILVGLRYE
jgi:vitamin B12 transporter